MEHSEVADVAKDDGVAGFVLTEEDGHELAHNSKVVALKAEPVLAPELLREMRRRPGEVAGLELLDVGLEGAHGVFAGAEDLRDELEVFADVRVAELLAEEVVEDTDTAVLDQTTGGGASTLEGKSRHAWKKRER